MTIMPICWAPARVREVINPEAESVPNSVFRAVHTDYSLKVAEPVGTSFQQLQPGAYSNLAPHELLKEFLRPERPHAQVAIIGRSGSGKSHLIHWLNLHLHSNERRLVLLIQKAGTSLRAILEMIIGELPGPAQARFLEELNRVGDATTTPKEQKLRLLNEIALAIRGDTPRLQSGDDAEVEEELIRALPAVFEDPFLRSQYYLKEGSIVASIVDHVFAAPTAYRRMDERYQFCIDDLPTGGSDFSNASSLARDAINTIYLDEAVYKPMAVDIINRNLNTAITRTLSFSGDRLIQLMLLLRQHLKKEGRDLVLLIEDFARLQGIDRALLQALLSQGDEQTCQIRWAIAVTTGFFESIAATVYTRMTYFVDMDRSVCTTTGGASQRRALANFTARYLNAVRLGRPALDVWHSQAIDTQELPPNACDVCSARTACHAAFGTACDNVGLYPFTERALWEMGSRVDDQIETGFNPRVLQNAVLTKVLDNYAPSLEAKAFPPRTLLENLKGLRHLRAQDRGRLETVFPEEGGRLVTALELWDASGQLVNLPEGIRKAFSLPLLPDNLVITVSVGAEQRAPMATTLVRNVVPKEIESLEQWARGGMLDQGFANNLRVRLFTCIADAIDWDGISLERSYYAGTTGAKPFRQNSIGLLRQQTNVTPSAVMLQIPAAHASEAEVALTATALQGLFEAERNAGNWDFPGGMEKLVLFLECVHRWAGEVTAQLQELVRASDTWSPVGAAVELLAVGAALSGRLKESGTYEEQLGACLQPWPTEIAAVTTELRNIFALIERKRVKLVALVRSTTSASKGGRSGALIDPQAITAALKAIRGHDWLLVQTPPPTSSYTELREMADLYAKVASALDPAATAERARRLEWVNNVRAAFGPMPQRANILQQLGNLYDVVCGAGIAGRYGNDFKVALTDFGNVQFDDAFGAFSALKSQDKPTASLPTYGRGRANALNTTERLIKTTSSLLQTAELNLAGRLEGAQARKGNLEGDLEKIRAVLTALTRMFSGTEDDHAA
jgi:energy-coupling factor transporter ATP-binding protein EcfA2